MAKKNIGASLALYPCPVIVVGAMVGGKPTWTLVAHAGTVAHTHLMVSLVQAHYINKGIRETGKLSVNVVDDSWLAAAAQNGDRQREQSRQIRGVCVDHGRAWRAADRRREGFH